MVVPARGTVAKSQAPVRSDRVDSGEPGHPLLSSGEVLVSRAVALVAGLALMVAGGGLCVTVVLLPFGLPIGLVGLFLAFAGVFGDAYRDRKTP